MKYIITTLIMGFIVYVIYSLFIVIHKPYKTCLLSENEEVYFYEPLVFTEKDKQGNYFLVPVDETKKRIINTCLQFSK